MPINPIKNIPMRSFDLMGIILKWSWRESRSALPLSKRSGERTLTRVRPREGATKWSWRESNPRPNKETIRFLHAYLRLRFSCCSKT